MTTTPTPRTDNEDHWRVDVDETGLTYTDAVRGDFARELERENAELRAALRELVAVEAEAHKTFGGSLIQVQGHQRDYAARITFAWTAARALVEPQ